MNQADKPSSCWTTRCGCPGVLRALVNQRTPHQLPGRQPTTSSHHIRTYRDGHQNGKVDYGGKAGSISITSVVLRSRALIRTTSCRALKPGESFGGEKTAHVRHHIHSFCGMGCLLWRLTRRY